MTTHLRMSRPCREHPVLELAGELCLALGRVHEICGASRRTLALMTAQKTEGTILWIAPHWESQRLNGDGVAPYINPGRLIFVHPKRMRDILWCMEEALRSGAVTLVVAEVPEPPTLTPVRRLSLAAEQGMKQKTARPLGLLLTPGDGGAAGTETRWHLSPRHEIEKQQWHLERRRARMSPPASWHLQQNKDGLDLCHKGQTI